MPTTQRRAGVGVIAQLLADPQCFESAWLTKTLNPAYAYVQEDGSTVELYVHGYEIEAMA